MHRFPLNNVPIVPAQRKRVEKLMETTRERNEMVKEQNAIKKKVEDEAKLIEKTWDSLAGQGRAQEEDKAALIIKKAVIDNISFFISFLTPDAIRWANPRCYQ